MIDGLDLRSWHLPEAIGFAWPSLLWLLAGLPLLALAYRRLVRRGAGARGDAARPRLPMTAGPASGPRAKGSAGEGRAGRMGAVRRHLPAALMGLGLVSLVIAIARPQAVVVLPTRLETVVLALDMSGSMRADDVKPTRLAAAQAAAKAFVADQPSHVRVGVVAVAGTAAVVQSPTHQRDDLIQAIDRLQPQRGTALGAGLIIALATLLPDAKIDVEREIDEGRDGNRSRGPAEASPEPAPAPALNDSAVLILLSDGVSNTGPDVATAIALASRHGVRIHTVGIGTAEGASVSADGWSMRVRLDEQGLRQIADATGADYFHVADAAQLKRIYRRIGARVALQKQTRSEVTALFAGAGALLASIAALLSMARANRIL
ncbi:MAG: VWA domain-containing protein [Burkholderiaceae bacterium]